MVKSFFNKIFSVFFFLGLALVKRYSEIITKMQNQTGKISGRGYYTEDREVIGVLGVATSYMSILIMALYITSPAVVGLVARITSRNEPRATRSASLSRPSSTAPTPARGSKSPPSTWYSPS